MLINYILTAIIGYMIGRIGHIYGGNHNSPHHWIYGLILFLVGSFLWNIYLIFFGAGLFISDLRDFVNLRFWGVDDVQIKKFWGID